MVTDRKCLMQTHSLSYPKSRDAIASKKRKCIPSVSNTNTNGTTLPVSQLEEGGLVPLKF